MLIIIALWLYSFSYYNKKNNPNNFLKKSSIFMLIFSILSLLVIKFPFGYQWAKENIGQFNVFVLGLSLASFFVYFLGNLSKVKKLIQKFPSFLIYVLIAAAALAYITLSLYKQSYHFGTFTHDLGQNDQIIWHLSQLHIPAPSSFIHINNSWGDHFNPLLLLIAPFYWLWNDVRILLIIEPIMVCLGALPLFWLIRNWLKNNFYAFCFAFGYLFYFGIQYALNWPFRGDTLATTFLVFALYFIFKKKWFWYFVMVILILMAKEAFGLYVAFLGIFIFWARKERIVGAISFIIGISWFFLIVNWLIPYFRGGLQHINTWDSSIYYGQLGGSGLQALKTILVNPLYVFHLLVTPSLKISTLITIFLPVGLLPFLAPSFLILAIPMIGERFLSDINNNWFRTFHYGITIAPIIFLGAAYAIKKWQEKINPILSKFTLDKFDLAQFGSIYLVIVTIVFLSFLQTPLLLLAKPSFYQKPTYAQNINEIIKFIPPDASVSAHDPIFSHLSHRNEIYRFPDISGAEYIVFDIELAKAGALGPTTGLAFKQKLNDLIQSHEYGLKKVKGTTVLLQKNIINEDSFNQEIIQYFNEDYNNYYK
jgi:uncharacterized membrane protein